VNQAFEHLLYLALYVAKDKGYFANEGLEVRIDTGGGDDKAFAALASGSAHFAQGDPAFVAVARQRGWEGRVIAMAVDRVAIWGIAKNPSIKPFRDPKGFRGLRVATYPSPNTSYVVQQEILQRAGLKEGRDSHIVQVAFGTELAALERGQVDIAQTIEPNVSAHEVSGNAVVFSYPEAWGPLAFTGVMTSERLIREEPATVQAFVNAYEKAIAYIHTNRSGALAIAKRRLPDIPDAVLERALNRLITSGSFPKHAAVDPTSWRRLLEIRVRVGDLPALPQETLYDNRFAEQASRSPRGSR
jgi:NitT/TauT family transport system substrate-binding protein